MSSHCQEVYPIREVGYTGYEFTFGALWSQRGAHYTCCRLDN